MFHVKHYRGISLKYTTIKFSGAWGGSHGCSKYYDNIVGILQLTVWSAFFRVRC